MPTFDRELWRSRATQRFQKAAASGKRGSYAVYTRDMHSIDQMGVLVNWAHRRGLEVWFGKRPNGVYEGDDKRITVSGRLAPERQLYVLMHECGHHLIGHPGPEQRYGLGYETDDPAVKRSTLYRVDVVDEELEAWARGLKLAKRLKVSVDLARYNRTRSEYVKSYLLWAARADGWEGSLDDG